MGPEAPGILTSVPNRPNRTMKPTSIDSAASPPHQPKGGEAAGSSRPVPKRWSVARKAEVAIRLLKGESLDPFVARAIANVVETAGPTIQLDSGVLLAISSPTPTSGRGDAQG